MIKVDIVNEVSKTADITKVKAEVAVDAVFDAMRISMQRGERIELRGFGVFQVKPRKRGIGRNPRTGKPNGVMGVPAGYVPFATPLLPTPKDGGSAGDPNFPFYETNTVFVPLQNGTLQRTTLGGFVDPMQNQFMLGPMQWNMSASAFKTVRVTERVLLRVNVDFLNNVLVIRKALSTADLSMSASAQLNGAPQTNHS